MNRRWQYAVLFSAVVLLAAAPARAQNVQTQMERVHDLAKQMFGLPVVYTAPGTPCPDPCPCANKCPCYPSCGACVNLSGTPNQKLLGRAWYWGWTLRNLPASSPTRACARQYLLDHINLQQTHGHYTLIADGGEIFTISHGQLWLAGMSAAYLFALTNGPLYGAGNTPDTEMLNAIKKWWADEKYAWDQISNNTGKLRMPGARFTSTPLDGEPAGEPDEWLYREQVYSLLRGQIPSGISNWPTDKYYTGGWIIDELRRRGHSPNNMITPPIGYTALGRIPETLCLYRRTNGDYLYYFPKMRGVGNPLFWVRREGGVTTYAPILSGTPNLPPASAKPANFPNATTAFLTGVIAGQCGCPAPDTVQTASCP
jgi:hypothetical protein